VLAFVTGGCVDDVRVEGVVPAAHGATQPSTNGQVITPEEACSRLTEAEDDARRQLRCPGGAFPGCPERLRLAGSLVCSEIDEGSVDECVKAISEYRSCTDLDSQHCVVTVVRSTCVNPYEAGAAPPPPPDASQPGEGGPAEGGPSGGGQPEGSTPPPPEAGLPPPDAPAEAGPVVTD
jgi:hypothetical protein